jgi:signal transduction histidine kinase/ligand-binding sensor domain-containing protein
LRSSSTCRSARRRRVVIWLLASLAVASSVQTTYAIDPSRALSQYVHDEWSAESGFPGGAVSSIAQTSDGYLWIGGEKGLVRFDGVTFRLVQHSRQSGFANTPVLALVADGGGSLWALLQGPTLVHYPRGDLDGVTPDVAVPTSLVTAMCRGTDGGLLLSSIRGGVMAWHNGVFREVASRTLMPASFVIAMAQTPSGDLWLGTRDVGLFRMIHGQIAPVTEGVPDRKINCLLPGSVEKLGGAELWIGSDNGVARWDGHAITSAGVPPALAHMQALALARDRDGNVWLAAGAGGLVRVGANGTASIEPRDRHPRGGDVTAVFEDREGNLWIGTTRGLERLRDAAFTTYATTEGTPADGGGALLADALPDGSQRLWFAPPGGGLYTLQDGRVQRIAVPGLANDVIYSIAGGRGGDLWLGRQQGGLTRFRASGGATTYTQADGLAQNSVYAVSQSRDGAVWAGTLSGGVSRFADGRFVTYTASANGLASNTITAMLEGADATMWFGTSNGLSALSKGKWTTYHLRDVLPSDAVGCLIEDASHVLWIGTGAGLAYLEAGRLAVPPRLPAVLRDEILGIEADSHGTLWIATTSRVLRVDRDKLREGTLDDSDVREYGLSDGLSATEGSKRYRSVITDERGRLWFSMARGISMVDPARANSSSAPAMAHVQAITADGVPIPLEGGLHIPAGRQRVTFSYVGLSLSVPERVRYRYKLEGFDRTWSEPVAAREAVYTNLGPGPYRFRLMASNGEGRWSETDASLPFDIDPALWQTRWFQASALLAFVAAAAALYRIRVRSMTHQMNMRFEERLAERTRIAQELHDTLLQGFVSASMQLHVAAEGVPAESPAKPTINRVLELMSRVIDEGRNAVRGLRSVSTGNDDLEQMFHRLQEELAVTTTSEFRVIVEGRTHPLHPLVRDEVHRIGREALINASRHANAKHIEVELEYAPPHHLRMLVRDDGAGIDADVLRAGRQGHWGLSGMRERAEQMGARLRLLSRKGAGTEVELSVPGHLAFVTATSATQQPRQHWLQSRPSWWTRLRGR